MLFVFTVEESKGYILCLDGAQVDKNLEWLEEMVDRRPNDIFFEAELAMS